MIENKTKLLQIALFFFFFLVSLLQVVEQACSTLIFLFSVCITMPSTCLGVAQELHKYFYLITQRLHYIYGRALEGNKIINKHVNNLHEIKFHNKNVLKYVVRTKIP